MNRVRHSRIRIGEWLFRHRGVLPLALAPLYLWALRSVEMSERHGNEQLEFTYQLTGMMIALLGLGIRALVTGTAPRGTSGRNTSCHEALVLNTSGVYSVVRHPLYTANYLVLLGCTVFSGSWWLPLATTVLFWPYYLWIIYAEEQFLLRNFGNAYTEWAKRTPAFFPCPRHWHPAGMAFSWKMVLRREYDALLLIGVLCGLSEVVGDLFFDPIPSFELGWALVLLACVVTALVLRTIKHRTVWLRVEDR